MYAIVDVGSNTVRLNIYRLEYGQLTQVLNRKESVGLASYVKNGQMMPSGIRRVTEVLSDFKSLLDGLNITDIHVFATAALRNARNSQAAVAEISQRSGLDVRVISGELEAELDFIGASSAANNVAEGLLVDIGGGSTELVPYRDGKMLNAVSLPFGSLNTHDAFISGILPTIKERKTMLKAITAELENLPEDFSRGPYPVICGVGGTARAANKVAIDMFRLPSENSTVKFSQLKTMVKLLERENKKVVAVDALDLLIRVVPFRVRTLLPGMIVLWAVAKYFGGESIEVTEAGVREGYLYKFVVPSIENGGASPYATETQEAQEGAANGPDATRI